MTAIWMYFAVIGWDFKMAQKANIAPEDQCLKDEFPIFCAIFFLQVQTVSFREKNRNSFFSAEIPCPMPRLDKSMPCRKIDPGRPRLRSKIFMEAYPKLIKVKKEKKSKDPILKLLPALVLLKIIMSRASNVSATKKKKDPNYTWLLFSSLPPRWNRGDKQGGTRVAFFWGGEKKRRGASSPDEFCSVDNGWMFAKGNNWRYTHLFHWTIYSWEGRVRFFSKQGKDMSNSITSIGDSHEKRTIPLST